MSRKMSMSDIRASRELCRVEADFSGQSEECLLFQQWVKSIKDLQ